MRLLTMDLERETLIRILCIRRSGYGSSKSARSRRRSGFHTMAHLDCVLHMLILIKEDRYSYLDIENCKPRWTAWSYWPAGDPDCGLLQKFIADRRVGWLADRARKQKAYWSLANSGSKTDGKIQSKLLHVSFCTEKERDDTVRKHELSFPTVEVPSLPLSNHRLGNFKGVCNVSSAADSGIPRSLRFVEPAVPLC